MAENKCPCLVVYNQRLGERLMGSGSQSDRYIVDRATIECVKSFYDGTLVIDSERCVTLPNGITGILNTDVSSMTDSEFMIMFDEPLKNMSVEARPQPVTNISSTIQSIKFNIDQVTNSLTFNLADTTFLSRVDVGGQMYGYYINEDIRSFSTGVQGSSTQTYRYGEFTDFTQVSDPAPFLDTTPDFVQPLIFYRSGDGTWTGPRSIKRTGDIKVLAKFDFTIGTYAVATLGTHVRFDIGYYDASTTSGSIFNKISSAAWSPTRVIAGDPSARDRRHYTGHIVFDTTIHNDQPDFPESELITSFGEGFSLIRPLAIKTTARVGTPTLVLTDLRIDYKWYC